MGMEDEAREALLVIRPGASTSLEQVVGGAGQVTQRISRRVAVVELGPRGLEPLRGQPQVEALFTREPPADELEGLALDEAELLFARAWFLRHAAPKAERAGDGLAWDAPGYLPPDKR